MIRENISFTPTTNFNLKLFDTLRSKSNHTNDPHPLIHIILDRVLATHMQGLKKITQLSAALLELWSNFLYVCSLQNRCIKSTFVYFQKMEYAMDPTTRWCHFYYQRNVLIHVTAIKMSAILLTLNTARTSNLTYRTRKIKRSRVYYHLVQSQLGNEPEKSLPLKHNTCFHSVHLFLRFVLHTPIISHCILHVLTLIMVSHMMKVSAYKLVRTYM